MKTAVLPPIRVDPKVKKELETVLEAGETLSSFILKSSLKAAQVRRAQRAFVEEAEARSKEFHRTAEYATENAVFARIQRSPARSKKKSD